MKNILRPKEECMRIELLLIFRVKKALRESSSCNCIALVSIDCAIRMNEKYYPQAYLCECKYQIRKNKIENMIDDDLASDSESDSELDYESCSEE